MKVGSSFTTLSAEVSAHDRPAGGFLGKTVRSGMNVAIWWPSHASRR